MVKEIQTTDEYYDSYDDEDDDVFAVPIYFETDEQLVLVACLMLLEQRYRVMKSMTPQEVVDEVESIMVSLSEELSLTATERSVNHIEKYFLTLLEHYAIPDIGYVEIDTSRIEIMNDSLNALINQLRDELIVKAKHFSDDMSKDDFNILPNFRRAVRKLIDGVGSNLIWGKEKTKRNVYNFVYGEDKLYRWLTMNDDKVCEWCRLQESMPPRLLSEIPLDHLWGRCEVDPVDYTYSSEYYLLLDRGEWADGINAYALEELW